MKGHLKGSILCKFQLYSTFHFGVKGLQKITSISVKTPYYSPWFLAKIWKLLLRPKRIPLEKASQEEHNGTNFSFIAPSSEELWVHKHNYFDTATF